MIEFTYKEKSSLKDFDIVAKSVNRPLLPVLKKNEISLNGVHGTYDFENNTYDNRSVSILLQFVGKDMNDLRTQARNIAEWLSSTEYLPLVFDDEPDKYYLAKVYDASELKSIVRAGEATVEFSCKPFAYALVSTGEDIFLESNLHLNSTALLNKCSINIAGNTDFIIDYIGTQEVGLGSPPGSLFNIVITGSIQTMSININGKTLTYTGTVSGQEIIIDNIRAKVKVDGSNALFNVTGDIDTFLQLIPGENIVHITGTGLNCSVLFDYREQYI